MAYGKGKGGKGGKVGAGKSKKAPLSRSVRAGLQVRPFSPVCLWCSNHDHSSQLEESTDSWNSVSHKETELVPRPRYIVQLFSNTWPLRYWNWLETPPKISRLEESPQDIYSSLSEVMMSLTVWLKLPSQAVELSHIFTRFSSERGVDQILSVINDLSVLFFLIHT